MAEELIPQAELDRIQKAIDMFRELKSLQSDPDIALRERCLRMAIDIGANIGVSEYWFPIEQAYYFEQYIKTGQSTPLRLSLRGRRAKSR